ncbi:NADH-quinone oxidoreductase subunit H [Actinopolyspora alba]|uniref:NADH-quinone oxidoreductase subunit H n=1 Tax=Actinopolyspora alba TaxID=673379 RepID=A0A1I2AF16_9ACTN|nr:complex I subunit 1 family protein [Actinopolyspora alba]SFE42595.1 NADH-quinone oxidoreductase subunit H [Actinopolyspora alba]
MTEGTGWAVLVLPLALTAFALLALAADAVVEVRVAHARRSVAAAAADPWREVARLLVGQRRTTVAADGVLWRSGVVTVPLAALLAALVLPLGGFAAADPGVGIVWFNAMEILGWAALWTAGWGPNSPLSLIGGYRFVAQGMCYELPHMFALITAATGAGTLRVGGIVDAQAELWFVVWMPVGFVVYLISAAAMAFWGPFDAPLGRDLSGGVVAELSGVDRLVLLTGRWLLVVVAAGMAVPLFLGGGRGPLLPAWLWTLVKTALVLTFLLWSRRRFPTVRMERFTEVSWLVLLPLTILQALIVALVVLV